MKAILLLAVIHLLILHQSEKQVPPKTKEISLTEPVWAIMKDSLIKEFIDHQEPLQYSSLEIDMQKR